MERSVFIPRSDQLRYVTPQYSRVYFGNEFCERLMPGAGDLAAVRDFVLRRKLSFTFVTPLATDRGITALRPACARIIQDFPGAEIVVNDWGVLLMLREEFDFANVTLGRLLTRQKKGPRILGLLRALPARATDHFMRACSDVSALRQFFRDFHVNRLEFDNLLQGIERWEGGLPGSLYFPYACISVTRYCLPAVCSRHDGFVRSIPECGHECRAGVFRLKSRNMPVDIKLKGNAQFFENYRIPDDLQRLNIDRTVFEPEIPL